MPEHIVDTGPLVGWINRRDQWHGWSVLFRRDVLPHVQSLRAATDRIVFPTTLKLRCFI
jgi:hypothetical protein